MSTVGSHGSLADQVHEHIAGLRRLQAHHEAASAGISDRIGVAEPYFTALQTPLPADGSHGSLADQVHDHIARLRRSQAGHDAASAEIAGRIGAAEQFLTVLQTPLPADPDVAGSESDAQSSRPSHRGSASSKGPKARRSNHPHPAVEALTDADLSPYLGCKDFVALGLTYARHNGGVVRMQALVPLAVRLGITKAVYKNAWSNLYTRFMTHPAFVKSGKGEFTVDSERTVSTEAA